MPLRIFAECFCLQTLFMSMATRPIRVSQNLLIGLSLSKVILPFAAGVQEMLLQSHRNMIEECSLPFHPTGAMYHFTDLRGRTVLSLVSATMVDGAVKPNQYKSEKGGTLRLRLPD